MRGNHDVRRTVREETINLLRKLDMTTIFGNPGSSELPFLRAWPADFRYVLGLQEAAVVAMADGFAQAVRKPVLVNLHATAGVGHGLGNLFCAYRNHTPLVVLAGQQPRAMLAGRPYLAGGAPRDFPKPYVKSSIEPARAEDVPEAIYQAIRLAVMPPQGPTFVSVPADDWDAYADPFTLRPLGAGFVAPSQALRELAVAVNAARSPALVAGPGIDRDGAWSEMLALAERTVASVWMSPVTSRSSFPEDHPLFMGYLPPLRDRIMDCLASHDVILVIGAPLFTYHVLSPGDLSASGSRFFHLTDDPDEASSASIGTTLLTTIKPALAGLGELVRQSGRVSPAARARPHIAYPSDSISPDLALQTLAEALPKGSIVVEEAPSHRPLVQHYLPAKTSGSYYTTASGGMGFGLPAAVGIALADRSRRVVAVLGDGACQYTIQALWNAAQLKLPIVFVILNNGGYAALKMLGRNRFNAAPPGVDLPGIDLTDLACGYGCQAQRVTKPSEVAPAFANALADDRPYLLDIVVPPLDRPLY